MVDEQEGCEWMDVSSGTGSPGQTRTEGRKMVVCVCVCVFVTLLSEFTMFDGNASFLHFCQYTHFIFVQISQHLDFWFSYITITMALAFKRLHKLL